MNRIELIASGSRCITVHLWQVVSSHLVSYPHATLQCARNWKLMRAPQRDRRGTWTIPGHPAGRQFWRRLWSTHESLAQPCISEPIATTTWTDRQTDRQTSSSPFTIISRRLVVVALNLIDGLLLFDCLCQIHLRPTSPFAVQWGGSGKHGLTQV